jgi:hypothetical protein
MLSRIENEKNEINRVREKVIMDAMDGERRQRSHPRLAGGAEEVK